VGHLAAVAAAACTLTWHAVPSPAVWGAELRAVGATATDDAWAVGGPAARGRWTTPVIEHWNGRRWRVAASPAVQGAVLDDVAVIARNDAWAVGERPKPGSPESLGSVVEHWDGVRWHRVFLPSFTALTAVSAVAGDDVWAVARDAAGAGVVVHWDGSRWQERLRRVAVTDVTALAADDVWVVGRDAAGYLELHWDGKRWTRYSQQASDASAELVAVAGAGGDVWAAGDIDTDGPGWPAPVLLHWTGRRWQKAPPPPKAFLLVDDLLVTAPDELWLTAYRGNGDAYGGGVRERLAGGRWRETDTRQFVVIGLAADREGGLWGVGGAGSYPDGLGFPTVVRPLIERARCS
jgi:hypothetical protein